EETGAAQRARRQRVEAARPAVAPQDGPVSVRLRLVSDGGGPVSGHLREAGRARRRGGDEPGIGVLPAVGVSGEGRRGDITPDAVRGNQPGLGEHYPALAPGHDEHGHGRPEGGDGGEGPTPDGGAGGTAGRLPVGAGRGGGGREVPLP